MCRYVTYIYVTHVVTQLSPKQLFGHLLENSPSGDMAAVPGQQVQDVLPHVGAADCVVVHQLWG